jgi:HK97 family phage major capsid protein
VDPKQVEELKTLIAEGNARAKAVEGKVGAVEARLATIEQHEKERGISPDPKTGERTFSIAKVVRGLAAGGLDSPEAWKGAEREREIGLASRDEARKSGSFSRVMSVGTAANGGYITPFAYVAQMIDRLLNKMSLTRAGITTISGLKQTPISFPRQTGGVTCAYVAENGSISDSTPTFDQVSVSPHLLACLVKTSRRLVNLADPAIEGVLRATIERDMALKMDSTGLYGTGVAPIPSGVYVGAGAGQRTNIAGAATLDLLLAQIGRLELDNAPSEGRAFVMSPRTFYALLASKDGASRYQIQPDVTRAGGFTIFGVPVIVSGQVSITLGGGSDSEVYLASWPDVWHAVYGDLLIETTVEGGTSFADHQMWIKATMEDDWLVTRAKSVQVLTGVTN